MDTIAQLVDKQSVRAPDQTFLRFEDEVITFGDLKRRVTQTAASLSALGVNPGDRVGLMMANHPEHVILYLALSWLGAVSVEFSIHLKSFGLGTQLWDAEPRFMFADAAFADELESAAQGAAFLEKTLYRGGVNSKSLGPFSSREAFEKTEAEQGNRTRCLDRVQTISYTSGTTGKPKGAQLTERWFQIGAKNAGVLAGVRSDDVLFLWEPLYHVAGWMTVLISLQHGVPIAMVERFSASQCWNQIRRHRATLLHYLGGAMNLLLKQPPRPDDADNPVRIAWGAAAPTGSWRDFEKRFGVVVREGYGLSEGQNFTHINIDGPVGSIGRPVAEFDSWIEGEDGTRLQPGEIGEIVLKPKIPDVTMLGYFRDADKTAEVLRNGRVYTGDLGYQDEEGCFYFSGRKKDSLRRRGENVSAWEVESVINAHPAVEESAVIGVASEMGEQDIKAFIKLSSENGVEPLDLIKWCEQNLGYYQVPRYLSFVEDFPRGPTQRIRKTELPQSVEGLWDLEQSGYQVKR